ncbi:MAG: UDP-N-acetylmuramoyl-tripeptide--D-alanyl-D-alanine ligase [Thermodesulfobacteriota bacterium]
MVSSRKNNGPKQDWRLDQVIEATGGKLASGNPKAIFRAVSTDSRSVAMGALFVALRGDNFDGEKFCGDAVRLGAVGVLVTETPKPPLDVPVIVVDDTLQALGDLAAYRRAAMKNLTVLAITGSSGKTTVKEMLAAIFARRSGVIKTRGNFNNLIGLPLSLLPVDSSHQIAILEMGMNQPGEIARMTEIASPDLACINNIQSAHLQGLASIEGVATAKGELFAGMKAAGILIVNLEDPLVRKLARHYRQKKITYGWRRQAVVRGTYLYNRGENGYSFTLSIGKERGRVRLQCLGRHNVLNALAAAALGYGAGVPFADICRGLAQFTSYDKRLQVEQMDGGLKVVNDTYNANPASMLAALETVQGLRGNHRSVAVLGDMLELGAGSGAAHRAIGEAVAKLDFDYLLGCGSFAEELVAAAREAGMTAARALAFADKDKIVTHLRKLERGGEIGPGDWLLVKGSRGAGMETVITALQEDN